MDGQTDKERQRDRAPVSPPQIPFTLYFLSLVLSESLTGNLHLLNSFHSSANECWTTDQRQKGHRGQLLGVENGTLRVTAE